MEKIRLSVVSYINTLPFIYGLRNSGISEKNISIELDIPSICAQKLLNNQADIGLVPVAIIPKLKSPKVISDFCIGASGKVQSVLLLSDVPLNQIKTVLLDFHSRTSVNLVKVLAQKHWKISPKWENGFQGYEESIKGETAGVIIGDRTFFMKRKYKYVYDLSEEWTKLTGLPFVFAAWVANKKVPAEIIKALNNALRLGTENMPNVIDLYKKTDGTQIPNISDYLHNKIDYILDEPKKEAMSLFFKYLKEIDSAIILEKIENAIHS